MKMFVDPSHPGIIRWNDDPTMGILAGVRATEIVQAVNNVAEAATFLDRMADRLADVPGTWRGVGLHIDFRQDAADCREMASKLRGEQQSRNPYGEGDPAEIDGT